VWVADDTLAPSPWEAKSTFDLVTMAREIEKLKMHGYQ